MTELSPSHVSACRQAALEKLLRCMAQHIRDSASPLTESGCLYHGLFAFNSSLMSLSAAALPMNCWPSCATYCPQRRTGHERHAAVAPQDQCRALDLHE
jgi:hypothetical protein